MYICRSEDIRTERDTSTLKLSTHYRLMIKGATCAHDDDADRTPAAWGKACYATFPSCPYPCHNWSGCSATPPLRMTYRHHQLESLPSPFLSEIHSNHPYTQQVCCTNSVLGRGI